MVHREPRKTILDLFRSGKEIDAAVRRAVREAVPAPSPARSKAKSSKKKPVVSNVSAAPKRASPRRKAA
jgi:hypothetical protein